jgi:hypothetical protein
VGSARERRESHGTKAVARPFTGRATASAWTNLQAFSVLTLFALITSGCAVPSTAPEDQRLAPSLKAYAQQQLAHDDLSDWDRAVIEKASQTGTVSQADYDEGTDNFEACLNAAGLHWTRTRLLNGVVEFQPPPGSAATGSDDNAAMIQAQCYQSTYAYTQDFFGLQQANPELLADFSLAAVNCLKKAGVVDDDFTTDDFGKVIGAHDSPITDWPFDVADPRAQTCLYSLGYAVVTDAK